MGFAAVPGVGVVSRERVGEVLRELGLPAERDDPAVAVRLGRELGARSVISGGYQSLGDGAGDGARHRRARAAACSLTHRSTAHATRSSTCRTGWWPRWDRACARQLPAPLQMGRGDAEPEAYEAFSKGLLNLRSESQEALDRAMLFFERRSPSIPPTPAPTCSSGTRSI